jgi:type VII secretion-associated serine protease mycosin
VSRHRSARRTAARLVAAAAACVAATLSLGVAPASADPIRDGEYQLRALDAASAWRYSTGAGVTVAVLDSGVDGAHPDLAGQVLPGADFVDGSTDGRRDFVGHGTTVAALIAGRSDKDTGVAGLAPGARILPVRVLDAQNKYDDATTVASGLRWAVDHGARVVNISLGGGARSDTLFDALAYAQAHDVVVIACTGNVVGGESGEVWYPARQAGVVAVAGLNDAQTTTPAAGGGPAPGGGTGGSADALWAGSLTGPSTVLTAPAVNLIGPRPGGYWKVQGTSFAAPLVTATATLIRSRWPTMSAANVINRMIRTARDLGPAGRDDRYGYGEVEPVAALTAKVPAVRLNPLEPPPPAVQRLSAREPSAAGTPVAGSLRVLAGFAVGALGSVVLFVVGLFVMRRLIPHRD